MTPIWANPLLRSRYLAAAVAGLLLTGAFPKFDLAGLAWLAPGLMAAAAIGKNGAERWRIGFVAGLAFHLSMLYWLLNIPFRWHGIPLGPALGWVALSTFLSLFTATWVWFASGSFGIGKRRGAAVAEPDAAAKEEPAASNPHQRETYGAVLPRSWLGRLLWALGAAAVWVGLEMIKARIFGGFPWDLLGVSQYRLPQLTQIASVTGVYGVSFLVVWVSMSLLSAGLMIIRRPAARSVWVGEMFVPLLAVAVVFSHGVRQLRDEPPPSRTLRVTMVQPSIPQTLIWDQEQDTNRFQALVEYTKQVLTNKTDLLIWPESAVPKPLRYDQDTLDAISGLARRHGLWMIIGSDDIEPSQTSDKPHAKDYYNSSFLIGPDGQVVERYLKRNLVIFGEYVPLQRWLPFLGWFTPVQGGFSAGKESVAFRLEALDVRTSVLICFEDVFPQLARLGVDPETDFLVNITNDGWFGQSAAQWQQAVTALFRAVENRVPLIRCCNNGVTCWIDGFGRIRSVLRDGNGTVYGQGFLTAEIPVGGPGDGRALTFYTRHGDVFGWICVTIAGVLLLPRFIPRRLRPA